MPDEAPPIREQLVEARRTIAAQLDELNFRASRPRMPGREGGPPDYGGLIAELQDQLREIDALLDDGDSPGS
ncbi:MAG TPA: hypothetical protein VFW19_07010 [Allosphingosinicella sp.]|nr:hypothetical protein [Allosphingosinicella sp.]